ncbi:hypothetical protein PUN28_006303 [Cardiocondyla obscurior]|uniref:Uncharacterized protein n=1 Tax=Cardiocondyla obscurior TaxID=286306 RepID=A0AAW2GBU4_9HYME
MYVSRRCRSKYQICLSFTSDVVVVPLSTHVLRVRFDAHHAKVTYASRRRSTMNAIPDGEYTSNILNK